MRVVRIALFQVLICQIASQLGAQQSPAVVQRDTQAVSALSQAVVAMANAIPEDWVAYGSIVTTAGSLNEDGALVLKTRRTNQTSEDIQTAHGSKTVFSKNQATRFTGSSPTVLSLELALSSQSAVLPLTLISGALNNPDSGFSFIGLETLNEKTTIHIRTWNSFTSNPDLQPLTSFTYKDIWIDANSFLPVKLSYTRRDSGGATYSIPVEVNYSDYKTVAGFTYPLNVQISIDGTPWASVTVNNVSLNVGLSDADFSLQ
jgi:hypothetical protein